MILYNPLIPLSLIDEVKQHASDIFPNECCGALINDKYVRFENCSQDKENSFLIRNQEFDKQLLLGNVKQIIHSHNQKPHASIVDQEACSEMEVSYAIINLVDKNLPTHFIGWGGICKIASFVGRPFFFGVYDCLQLVYDYYKQKHNIRLPNPEREIDFIYNNNQLFEQYLDTITDRFTIVKNIDDIDIDDICFYVMGGKIAHVGVYIGDEKILHHWFNQKSNYYPITYKKEYFRFIMRLK